MSAGGGEGVRCWPGQTVFFLTCESGGGAASRKEAELLCRQRAAADCTVLIRRIHY